MGDMNAIQWNDLKEELQKGATQKGHPFRYFTLGTVGLDRMARLRTLVLRKVSEDLKLYFFTDDRSKKIIHLKENNKVGLLFYHPEKLMQLKVEGLATVYKDDDTKNKYWSQVDSQARKGYTTTRAPGSELEDPGRLEYLEDKNHFCVVAVTPFKMEYLKLQSPHHLRIRYSLRNGTWTSDYLVP
jgi:general stress protein 26